MPNYEFTCPHCDIEYLAHAKGGPPQRRYACPVHPDVTLKRVLSFATPPPANQFGYEGYDPGLGQYVSSKRDKQEKLKVASAATSARQGYETNFIHLDPTDMKAMRPEPSDAEEGESYNRPKARGQSQRKTVYL